MDALLAGEVQRFYGVRRRVSRRAAFYLLRSSRDDHCKVLATMIVSKKLHQHGFIPHLYRSLRSFLLVSFTVFQVQTSMCAGQIV